MDEDDQELEEIFLNDASSNRNSSSTSVRSSNIWASSPSQFIGVSRHFSYSFRYCSCYCILR